MADKAFDPKALKKKLNGKQLLLAVIGIPLAVFICWAFLSGRGILGGLKTMILGDGPDLSKLAPTDEETLTVVTLAELAKPASELVALKYYYTDADEYEQHKEIFSIALPGTTNHFVFVYSGIISAGIDFSGVEYQIAEDAKRITVRLPEPYIISHEMKEKDFKFYDVSTAALTPLSMKDYTELMAELKQKKESAFLRNKDNFLQIVLENAEKVIEQILTATGKVTDYSIGFTLPDLPNPAEAETDAGAQSGTQTADDSGKIAVPDSAKSYRGTQYETVRQKLTDAGFTNIVVEGKKELKGNWMDLSKDVGEIAEISIAGNDSFSKGDEFPENAAVRITYYDLKE